MTLASMRDEIKVDLGSDVNSLGIADTSIELKIKEALRKISSYSPFRELKSFNVVGGKVTMPDNTATVLAIYNHDPSRGNSVPSAGDDQDLFSLRKYVYGYGGGLTDPFTYMTQINQVRTLQGFISMKDFMYDRNSKTLFINDFPGNLATVEYLRAYDNITEVTSEQTLQMVKEYALALCKIIEGHIRRKLQSAPGSIQMDGDALVSEGTSEKVSIEASLPDMFKYLRFGLRV